MSKHDDGIVKTPEEILAEAEKKAKAILEEAEKAAREKLEAAEEKAGKKSSAKGARKETMEDDMVTVELFRDGDKYKDDIFVAVNGKSFQVKRGVPVRVPRAVFEVIQASKRQDLYTADLMEQKQNEYKAEAEKRGIG